MSKKSPKLPIAASRRQILALLGLAAIECTSFDPIRMMSRCLVDGLIADAQAQGLPTPKKFVSILFPGAPTRWLWDGFLNPNNETIVANGSVNNYLLTDKYISATPSANVKYRAEAVALPNGKTIYLPPLWNRNIPTSLGGFVPMNALLQNTLIMRGVDMQVDLGHTIGPAKVLYPLGARASLTGLVGDASTTPLPVVGTSIGSRNYADPTMQGYRSLKGTSTTMVTSPTNALSNMLSAFIYDDPSTVANATKINSAPIQQAINGAMSELGKYASSSLPGSDVLYKNAGNATKLFKNAFGDLKGVIYPTLQKKYAALAQTCAQTPIPNIIPSTSDLASYSLATGKFIDEFSYQFAVAEYLLVNGLSSAISMCSGANCGVGGIVADNDEHNENDRQRAVIGHSFQFLILSAMIYELRRVLIQNNMWDQTLIHVSSEFSRSPRTDGTGSDHASNSNVMTMMSGAIKQPIFMGNIKTNPFPTTLNVGTYGVSAPVIADADKQIVITNNIAAATAAAILGVQNPVTQSSPLVNVNSSGIVTDKLVEDPKNI